MSAVFGRPPNGGRSITTLNVPGSLLSDVTVCSSAVENECERTCAIGRASPVISAGCCCVNALSALTSSSGGVGSERGVLEPYKLCSQSLLVGRSFESGVALSGGVWGGKTNGSGWGRVRWFPARTIGLRGVEVSDLVVMQLEAADAHQ